MRWIILLTAALAGQASAARAETLADAMASAYRNSGIIEQQRAVVRAADEDVAQAVAELRPVVTWSLGISETNFLGPGEDDFAASLTLDADWLLYDFGRTDLAIEARKELVLAARAALEDAENTILLNAARAYFGVTRAAAFVELRRGNLRLLTEQLRATRDRFEVGEVTRTDVSLAEARLAAARSGLAAEEGSLAIARAQFEQAVGRPPAGLVAPVSPPAIPPSEAAALAVALAENPQIDQSQHQIRAQELLAEAAARAFYPSLNAGARFTQSDKGNQESLSLGLSGPIYQGGAISSRARQAQARVDQARAGLVVTSRAVAAEVAAAYAQLGVAIASIDAAGRQVRAANLALAGVREELQLGARTTLDVLDQENELLDARTTQVAASIDRYVAVYEALDAMGVLTVERLNLGVPVYDPSFHYNAVKDAPGAGVFGDRGLRLDRALKRIGRD